MSVVVDRFEAFCREPQPTRVRNFRGPAINYRHLVSGSYLQSRAVRGRRKAAKRDQSPEEMASDLLDKAAGVS